MTSVRRLTAPQEGVTEAAAGPQASPGRFLPPTAEEVGRAAALCFQDTDTDDEIARQLGIVRRTLARWKKRPDFAAAIAALQAWQVLVGEASGAAAAARLATPGQRSREDISREAAGAAAEELARHVDARPR